MMKMFVFLTLVLSLSASASSFSQNQRVSFEFKEGSILDVLNEIRMQTELHFIYNEDKIKELGTINVDASDMRVDELLEEIFKDTNLECRFQDSVIMLVDRKPVQPVNENQEKKELKGSVIDTDGNTLPGVSVVVKGTTIGVATDIDGNYSIKFDQDNAVLVFSFVGMLSQEIVYKGQLVQDVTLVLDSEQMDEVVVTGYQTISKERATGSFNLVSKNQIDKPTSNIGTRLIGNVSGIQATLDEEGNPTFEIRGKSSLFANSKPLIVVDGFAIEGDFSSINPNDVESVTVLKDAAAASIWGARSANGVIVVTTKSGKKLEKGSLKVSLNSFVKFSPKPDMAYLLNRASSEDAIAYDKMSFGKWGRGKTSDAEWAVMSDLTPGRAALNEHSLGYLSDGELDAILNKYASQNNQDQIKDHLIENPFIHHHNLGITSASEKFNNSLSIMYEGNQSYLKGKENKRILINYRTSARVFEWLDFNFGGMYGYKQSSNNASLADIKSIAPYDMLLDESGNRLPVYKGIYMPNFNRYWPKENFPYPDLSYNPITEMENMDYTNKEIQTRFQASMLIKPFDGLKFNSQIQYESFTNSNKNILGEGTYATRYEVNYYTNWDRANNTFTQNIPSGDILDQNRNEIGSLTFRNQLNFERTFGKHAFNVIAGMELNKKVTKTFTEPRVYGYDDDKLSVGALPNGLGSYTNSNLAIYSWYGYKTTIYKNKIHQFGHYTDKYVSAYFNGSYTYNDKYTLSGSARTDASNLITDDPAYRYSPFWSVGGGWNISKENFMTDIQWIDRLNLRATYGYNGNVDRSTSFLPLINMYATNNTYTDEPYASISSYGNPTLRWEKTGTFDLGIDYSLFRGKLFGKVDVYHKSAKDLVASVSIPAVNGVAAQKMNVADMINKGIEVEVGTKLAIAEKMAFYGNFNVSYNFNKITKLYRAKFGHSDLLPWNASGSTAYVEGENANMIYGSHYAGLHNDGTSEKPNMQPKIEGKDGTLYGFGTWPADDVMNYAYAQGTKVAPWVMGLSFGFKIHDFDLSCIMTGKFGHVFRRTSYNYNDIKPNSRLSEVLNADSNEIMPLPQNDNESRYYFWDRFWKSFSYLTESANHVRMQEVNLTYNLPSKFLNKTGLESVKFYSQANNLFSIYANKYNEDPEYPLGTYKPTPVYTFGVKVGF
ncbi:SusC/RagA family TonB-linked outer membrane protein [Ancylomarina euxinus]|nr:SusC/RagA family TonB-linked outer membrane protein [Ancylomarina euxinus]MCZ4695596.1 SusC/RagA family TonB-linked outer membrane protein [Ancylomarina euxinus]